MKQTVDFLAECEALSAVLDPLMGMILHVLRSSRDGVLKM